ncbi:hypothetical protein TanjilG_13811 [Lupinus angustifolius]|uniref:H15 domain-containing protein n=1 Tax=Lupinus angustifolius TaxID=3871 RepID=A0A1J7H1D8_LUPAN|nr:hypothetical protein TanjilG_13811 [Lupinus angustifolius]
MDSYSSSILPSSPPHRPIDAYPNLNIINSFLNHPTSPATLAPPLPCNDDHTSYSKMICSAITALKDENGSSKTSIGNYIAQEYKDLLPPNHDTFLTQNLKYLKKKNILITVKSSYNFPTARSDKPMSLSLSSSSFVSRGHDCLPKPNPDSKSTPQLEQNVEPKSTKLGSQGAHLKPIVVPSAARSNDGGVPPPVDAHELAQLPSNFVPIGSPKPRGRPKKNVVASPSIAGCSAAYGGSKKPAVARKPMKKSIGKPMGRPKVILSYFF